MKTRTLTLLTLLTICASAQLAMAQTPVTPIAELVVQGAGETGRPRGVGLTPRLTFAVSPDTAIDLGGTFNPARTDGYTTSSSGTGVDLALRQRLWSKNRWQIFGLVGASWTRRIDRFPGSSHETAYGRVTVPPGTHEQMEWAAQVATAVQYEVHRHFALRADGRIIAGERGALGLAVGGVVPFGRGPQRPAGVERDSVREGLWIGGATGAAAGALSFAVVSNMFCEDDSCLASTVGATAAGAVFGAAMGGIVGAVIDGLHPGRRR